MKIGLRLGIPVMKVFKGKDCYYCKKSYLQERLEVMNIFSRTGIYFPLG